MRTSGRGTLRAAAAALALAGAPLVQAGIPTPQECLEAADFVVNAAHARDNGVERDAFIGRLDGDFVAIRAFPSALRWFVHDADDETFLRGAVQRVFDDPVAPERHRAPFLGACLERAARAGDGARGA